MCGIQNVKNKALFWMTKWQSKSARVWPKVCAGLASSLRRFGLKSARVWPQVCG